MATWREWLKRHFDPKCFEKLFPEDDPARPMPLLEQNWEPQEADRKSAWELYTELRTRITVQPLHYMHGDEETALQSVADLFKSSRELMREHGPQARHFAALSVFVLNRLVRPFTAQWHKAKLAGKLNNEDFRHIFRGDLIALQGELRQFTTALGALAEDQAFCPGSESWPQGAAAPAGPGRLGSIPFAITFDETYDSLLDDQAAEVQHETRERMYLDERNAIRLRRDPAVDLKVDEPVNDVAGLALSGGGIRSATFGLGVVQRMAQAGMLSHFDYLSTVSGGGYLGSCLSTYLNTANPDVGLSDRQLPFRKPQVGESAPLRHLRGHSKYLLSGGVLNRLNMGLLAIHGVLASLVIFWPLLAGLVLAVAGFQGGTVRDVVHYKYFYLGSHLIGLPSQQVAFGVMAVGLLSLAPAAILFRRLRWEAALTRWQTLVSFLLIGALLVTVWNLIPPAFRLVHKLFQSDWALPSTAVLSGAVLAIQRIWANLDWAPAASKLKRFAMMAILALVGPLFAAALFFWLGETFIVQPPAILGDEAARIMLLTALTFVPLLFAFAFLDINQTSLHPFYRRKLSQAYLIAHQDSPLSAGQVEPNDGLRLSELRNNNPKAPYHLINCALNAPSSEHGALRGRGTDFFLFSQLYCGSAATGYYPTTDWEKRDSHLNLGTAMAISAAAASPFMGLGSIPSANFLLSLFNVRLDYWLPVPGRLTWRAGPWYLFRQAFGWMNEKTPFVNVSDGGHIENLAIYELLRRRCRYIVAVDGECDPKLSCGSLMQLIRFAQIDFGIDIKLDITRFKLAADGAAPFHFGMGTIVYPPLDGGLPVTGELLYIKLSRTGNESPPFEYYRSRNADCPHQSTADQFFDEEQFEAYRSLGEHAANDLFSEELLGKPPQVATLQDWFSKIASALKDPNNK